MTSDAWLTLKTLLSLSTGSDSTGEVPQSYQPLSGLLAIAPLEDACLFLLEVNYLDIKLSL